MSRRRLQLLAFALDAAVLALLVLVPAHAYGWMRDLDPGMAQLPDDPNRDVRLLLTGGAVALAVALHGALAWRQGRRLAALNLGAALVLAVAWAVKYLF